MTHRTRGYRIRLRISELVVVDDEFHPQTSPDHAHGGAPAVPERADGADDAGGAGAVLDAAVPEPVPDDGVRADGARDDRHAVAARGGGAVAAGRRGHLPGHAVPLPRDVRPRGARAGAVPGRRAARVQAGRGVERGRVRGPVRAGLYDTAAELYDYIAKVEPQQRAYGELRVAAVFTGRRRSQGGERDRIPVLEIDEERGIVKINPLLDWSFAQVKAYIAEHDVPYNVLLDRGYKSVGDWHSTSPVAAGEDERAGRWKGQQKTECGIHNKQSRYAQFLLQQQLKDAAAAATSTAPSSSTATTAVKEAERQQQLTSALEKVEREQLEAEEREREEKEQQQQQQELRQDFATGRWVPVLC
ncbi:hypothetical protein CIB48_g248 [Xylaria polymorpha]|nr:hypothetical protein CIB48_g248 [Xylaria polymorpha]